jgi:hypothetical protein
VIDSDIPRKKFISSAPAESIFLIINPVKLIKIDPQSINIIALLRKLEKEKYIRLGYLLSKELRYKSYKVFFI